MCGIAGFVTDRSLPFEEAVRGMTDRLAHRGPDDAGCWIDYEAGVALGHRRLSIVDLSPNGHQPMVSACGRYVIVLNGEIYNHQVLRESLDSNGSPMWRGRSDTEVLLEMIAQHGIEHALKASVGMFAFALWDRSLHTLCLARDRLGEKPLYYGMIGSSFVFGSELKALTAFPGACPEIDRAALAGMMQFGYVGSPRSIYRGIHKLPPANFLVVQVGDGARVRIGSPERYWYLDDARLGGLRSELAHANDASLADQLDERLRQTVRMQMLADVPLGAFLSGGIDSSLIVALMQVQSMRPVRTFTIGFREDGYDEAPYAKAVARHLGTEHTEWYISPGEAASVIPDLPQIFDEPFADSSQVPTTLVARMTGQHVTVSLSGDGGDELFGGYPRYLFAQSLWRRFGRLPRWSRQTIAVMATSISPRGWDRILRTLTASRLRQSVNGHRVHRLAALAGTGNFDRMYELLLSQWAPDSGLVQGSTGAPWLTAGTSDDGRSMLDRMRQWDIDHYLPDDILAKVDRTAMSVGLETRAPLLDHRIAEFAWALPAHALVRDGGGKWLLRQVLQRYVPAALFERPKAGFSMPVAHWLRTDLRDWAEALLDERKLLQQGLLAPKPVRRMWHEHLAGTHDHQSRLWNVLMFQAWFDAQGTAIQCVSSGHAATGEREWP